MNYFSTHQIVLAGVMIFSITGSSFAGCTATQAPGGTCDAFGRSKANCVIGICTGGPQPSECGQYYEEQGGKKYICNYNAGAWDSPSYCWVDRAQECIP